MVIIIVQYMVRLWDNEDEGDFKTRAIFISIWFVFRRIRMLIFTYNIIQCLLDSDDNGDDYNLLLPTVLLWIFVNEYDRVVF